MLRDLLDAEDLPSQLLAAGIPACALATVVGLTVIMIASTAQLVQHRRAYRNRFISRDSRQIRRFTVPGSAHKYSGIARPTDGRTSIIRCASNRRTRA